MAKRPSQKRDRYVDAFERIEQCKKKRETRLNLRGLGLTALATEIGQLTQLAELFLDDNQLSSLPAEIGELRSLTRLHLDNNQLGTLPSEIGKLTNLNQLHLDGNQLSMLPPEVGQLTHLTQLYLDGNQLSLLPPEVGQLTNLTLLHLDDNKLNTLPHEVRHLANLTELHLDRNQLSVLPPEVGQLKNLTHLFLDENQLSTLPPEICKLTKLTELYLERNQLDVLPPEVGQLKSLTLLHLGENELSTLAPEIGHLTNLTALSLHRNQLVALPREMGLLTRLTELYLGRNQLSELPPEIGQLTNLTELYLFGNQLETLPPEMGRLSKLEKLELSDNDLRELPTSFANLLSLRELMLHQNDALALPAELLGPSSGELSSNNSVANPRAILDYYFSRRSEGDEPMREVRLLLVGRGRVGKTSLLKALRGEKPRRGQAETQGITVESLAITCFQGTATGRVWDFGGQEFLHGTHQIFLAERCLYLLVLEGRDGHWATEADYWLRFIQSYGGDSPVIVILNKSAEHPFSVDKFQLQERCPQIVGFIETDAFTKLGLEELRALIAKTTSGMKDVWLPVPKRWHQIMQDLREMPQNFIDYGEYQARCRTAEVKDESKQDSLAQTMHRLGVALNFRDHHRLRHTSVLKPKWVTEAIYGLIRYVQKNKCHGVLKLSDISKALDPVDYPAEKHSFVIELMEKFEVAFPMEGTTDWLIPELLEEVQPTSFAEFRDANVKRVRFNYPEAIPPGLLPRFIVRTHEMSSAHPEWRWHSGVYLEWRQCKALVRFDRSNRCTEVQVIECPPEEQQSLFDLIRAHLLVLHGNVRFVEEVELEGHRDSWVGVNKLRKFEEERTTSIKEETREGELVPVPVTKTLDSVESPEAREADRQSAPARMRLFVSYAHDDEKKIRPLSKHLTILGRRGYIQHWQDTQLVAGEEWKERIFEELSRADIVLLLYSTASRASRFIQEEEVPEAIKRRKFAARPCNVIVVPLDRKDWDQAIPLEKELSSLQTATWNAKPVLKFTPQADGWQEVEKAIRNAVEARRKLK